LVMTIVTLSVAMWLAADDEKPEPLLQAADTEL